MPLGTAFQSIPTFVRLYLAPKKRRLNHAVQNIAPFLSADNSGL